MARYDSQKIREIASGLKQLADGLDAGVKPGISGALEAMDPLCGRTAQAMEAKLEEFAQRADQLSGDFHALAAVALTYAERLEELDRELAREL